MVAPRMECIAWLFTTVHHIGILVEELARSAATVFCRPGVPAWDSPRRRTSVADRSPWPDGLRTLAPIEFARSSLADTLGLVRCMPRDAVWLALDHHP